MNKKVGIVSWILITILIVCGVIIFVNINSNNNKYQQDYELMSNGEIYLQKKQWNNARDYYLKLTDNSSFSSSVILKLKYIDQQELYEKKNQFISDINHLINHENFDEAIEMIKGCEPALKNFDDISGMEREIISRKEDKEYFEKLNPVILAHENLIKDFRIILNKTEQKNVTWQHIFDETKRLEDETLKIREMVVLINPPHKYHLFHNDLLELITLERNIIEKFHGYYQFLFRSNTEIKSMDIWQSFAIKYNDWDKYNQARDDANQAMNSAERAKKDLNDMKIDYWNKYKKIEFPFQLNPLIEVEKSIITG